ncbi:MAG: hypothetical protein OEW69_05220, partial [Nitrospirota bacterium]|nr:hypothetical protein [Nitrospirota bacterium]
PGTPGPFDTHYLVSNATSSTTTANMKCYNMVSQRIGPAGGLNISIPAYDMDVVGPSAYALEPNFTDYGWCYFARTVGDDIAVTFIAGLSNNGNLITSNSALALVADTAQSQVSQDDANLPYWTREGSWTTYLLALNPTAVSRNFTMNVYNSAGALQSTTSVTLGARDLDVYTVGTPGGFGNADITNAGTFGKGFVGWVAGVNYTTLQAFIYAVPLDKDDIYRLASGDRP